jgi:parallel beta-helix repeat protein
MVLYARIRSRGAKWHLCFGRLSRAYREITLVKAQKGGVMKNRLVGLLLCLAVVISTVLVGSAGMPVRADTLYVGSGGYATIQAAINAANPAGGDTVEVAAGTYGVSTGEVFPITIDRQVTLLGARSNVDPRPSHGGRTGAETIIDGGGTATRVIQMTASGVEINGFTVTGGTAGEDIVRGDGLDSAKLQGLLLRYNIIYSANQGDEGIQLVDSDGAVIEYNYAHNLFGDAFNICRSSNGVIRYNEAHDLATLDAGIYCYLTTNTDIVGNLVYRVDRGDNQYGNGIQMGDTDDGVMSTGGVIRDNIVHNIAQDGINVEEMIGVTVQNNTVYAADSWDGAIYIRNVQNSTFTNNRVYNNDAIGVLIMSSSGITISGNSICSNADTNDTKYPGTAGIWIVADSNASTIGIHSNNIHGNAEYGVNNLDTLHTASATGNWWGSATGPGPVGPGSGDRVSAYVDYGSWQAGPFAMIWYVSAGESIQAVVDAAHPADTVVVAAGTYVGKVTVNKTLTLNGANVGISAGATPGTRGPESIIQGGGQIQGNNVVLDGFKIDGPGPFGGQNDGIYIVGGTSGLTIANNVLAGHGRAQASDGWAMDFSAGTSGITVRNNYIGNWWSSYINPTNPGSNLLFEGNHFDSNYAGIGSDGLNDVNIQYNKFTGNSLEGFGTSNVGSNVRAHYNDFVGNAAGINHYGGGLTVDATNNWWGNASGPTSASNPGGTGDAVSGNVSFIPWTGMAAPTVTSILPDQGTQGQTLSGVVITGTAFVGVAPTGAVSFSGSGVTVNSYVVDSATKITANLLIAAGAATGLRDVSVTTSAGIGTKTGGFTVVASGPPVVPTAPTLASPGNGETVGGTSISFSWNAASGATKYWLVVSTNSNMDIVAGRKFAGDVGNVTSYNDGGYSGTGTRYYWWVWAGNATGWSPESAVAANGRYFMNGIPTTITTAPTLQTPANGATVGGSSVNFTWDAVFGATKYWLVVSTSSNMDIVAARKFGGDVGNVTSYDDGGYSGVGIRYYWWVWAGNATSWSPESAVAANGRYFMNGIPTTITTAPTLRTPANGAIVSGSSVNFTWDAEFGATKYWLVVSTNSNKDIVAARKFSGDIGNVTSYDDGGYPDLGIRYYWWVWAGNATSWSPESAVAANGRYFTNGTSITITTAPTLGTPANGAIVSGSSVNFTWDAVSGATKYWLVVSTNSNKDIVAGRKFSGDLGNVTSYNDGGYSGTGTKYYWWVWAGSPTSWSPESAVAANGRYFMNGIPNPITPAPTLRTPANGAIVSGSSVNFTWDAVSGATKYWLVVSTSSNMDNTAARKFSGDVGNVTSYDDGGYSGTGTRYYWWVWAGTSSSWSPDSAVAANGRNFVNNAA